MKDLRHHVLAENISEEFNPRVKAWTGESVDCAVRLPLPKLRCAPL
jgi:hypothetical protein